LITLTWITRSPKKTPTNHWKKLKAPALASLFDKNAPNVSGDLSATGYFLRQHQYSLIVFAGQTTKRPMVSADFLEQQQLRQYSRHLT
jgi:hypothetical protein